MAAEAIPTMQARFWGQDPRFALIGDNHYPVLLSEYLTRDSYSEDLSDFDGYREQFFALSERRSQAILIRNEGGEWVMESLRELSDVQMVGKTFRCTVMPAIASVEEV